MHENWRIDSPINMETDGLTDQSEFLDLDYDYEASSLLQSANSTVFTSN